jgi:hypothetical protein
VIAIDASVEGVVPELETLHPITSAQKRKPMVTEIAQCMHVFKESSGLRLFRMARAIPGRFVSRAQPPTTRQKTT